MGIKAVIFDLDGVIVSTDEYHYQAWKRVADEEGIPFDRKMNEALRGVSRMESLEIMLKHSTRRYGESEKDILAKRKNEYYCESLEQLRPSDILPGVMCLVENLKKRGIRTAIGSSSKNALSILEKIKMHQVFEVIITGNDISHSKPDPEVFLLAAKRLGICPGLCLVIEDAKAGIAAAKAAGMIAVGVGAAAECNMADYVIKELRDDRFERLSILFK